MAKDLEKQLEEKGLPNRDWLQEGCYHSSPVNLISTIRRKWNKYSPEERNHMAGIYTYPGGFFKLNNDDDMSIEVKCNKQVAAELMFYKDITADCYADVVNSSKVKLTEIERRYINSVLQSQLDDEKENKNVL